MPSRSEAEAAIAGLNGKALDNRTVTVNEARPRPDSGRGGSYGGRQDDFRGRGQRRY
jgi:RNA recognition motif-containing protein